MKWILFIIGLILGIACCSFLIYFVLNFVKKNKLGEDNNALDKKTEFYLRLMTIGQGLFVIMSSYGLVVANHWELNAWQHIFVILGSYLMGSGFVALFESFTIYYYKPQLEVKQRRFARILMFIAIPCAIVGIYLLTQGVADFLTYPLYNALAIPEGLLRPNEGGSGFRIAFYAICILGGATICYFICDYYTYKVYKQHGILENLLIAAFVPGIIGARLWFCFVLETDYFVQNPGDIFKIWNGGLAIQGGVILGAICGIAYMLKFKKFVNIRFAMDVIIPTILIAQGVGRIGNFFNLEVHGNPVELSNWLVLPKIIANNMHYSIESTVGTELVKLPDSQIYLPLFFIESVMNFTGYFVIRYAVGKGLRKYLSLGDLSMSYLIWYGMTRAVLEPLREGFTKNVGTSSAFGYMQSWLVAFAFILVGILGIVGFHLYDYLRKKKGLEPRTLDTL